MQKLFTDHPFRDLGDSPNKKAPIRQIQVLSYDGDKYCRVLVDSIESEVKAGYIYTTPGRCGEVPCFDPSNTDFPTMNCDYMASLSLYNNQPTALVLTRKGHSTIITAKMLVSKRLHLLINKDKNAFCPAFHWLENNTDSVLAQLHEYSSFCSIKSINLLEKES